MADLHLSLMMSANDRSQPVLDGTIRPDGIDLVCTVGHPSEIFWRQLHFKEFDVKFPSLGDRAIVFENGGWIYRFDLDRRVPELINTGDVVRNNNDHVISFDGKMLAISSQPRSAGPSSAIQGSCA